MTALLHDTVTVETAAKMAGIDPRNLLTFAALGGRPRAFGPFISVDGSDYRIMIDADDLRSWIEAGMEL